MPIHDTFDGRNGGHRAFDEGEGRGHRGGHFRQLPEHFGDGEPRDGLRTLPERRDGGGFRTLPERDFPPRAPGGPGFPRGGMPPRGAMPPFGGMPPREPSPDLLKARIAQADLGELLALAGRMAQRRPNGDPSQGQNLILSILAGRQALNQRALQLMLGVQPGSLSEILTKLERKGLITREKAEDRRGNVLRITEAGRQAIPEAEPAEADDRFAALTDEQQAQLAELLRTLLGDWVEHMDAREPHGRFPGGHHPGGRFNPPSDELQKI